ncbi:hypothetical protein L5515_018907 [Caenorhabditis briggsae]|uniref:Uncharacterized protein n=1 Tax=Caenorhabditis briggsae TaxID=6238 RepID=A0AAE9FGX6_CAEBR|nr:hypothetical protein L5515_018907 [Caenorhabditis briggsae]
MDEENPTDQPQVDLPANNDDAEGAPEAMEVQEDAQDAPETQEAPEAPEEQVHEEDKVYREVHVTIPEIGMIAQRYFLEQRNGIVKLLDNAPAGAIQLPNLPVPEVPIVRPIPIRPDGAVRPETAPAIQEIGPPVQPEPVFQEVVPEAAPVEQPQPIPAGLQMIPVFRLTQPVNQIAHSMIALLQAPPTQVVINYFPAPAPQEPVNLNPALVFNQYPLNLEQHIVPPPLYPYGHPGLAMTPNPYALWNPGDGLLGDFDNWNLRAPLLPPQDPL